MVWLYYRALKAWVCEQLEAQHAPLPAGTVCAAVTQLAWSPSAAGLYMGRAVAAGLYCVSESALRFAVPGVQEALPIRLSLSLSCPEEQEVCGCSLHGCFTDVSS